MECACPPVCLIVCLVSFGVLVWAATTGSISGTTMDPSGAIIPGAMLISLLLWISVIFGGIFIAFTM